MIELSVGTLDGPSISLTGEGLCPYTTDLFPSNLSLEQ